MRNRPISPVNVAPPASGLEGTTVPGIERNSHVPKARAENKTPATDQRRSRSLVISSESSRVVESSQATTKRKGTTGNALDSEIQSDCHDKINAVVSKDVARVNSLP